MFWKRYLTPLFIYSEHDGTTIAPNRSQPVAGRLQLILGFDDGQPIRLQGGTRHLWEGAVRDHHLTNMGELADARLELETQQRMWKNHEKPMLSSGKRSTNGG